MTSHLKRLAGAPGGAKAIFTGCFASWAFIFVSFASSVALDLAVNTAGALTGSLTTTVRAGIPGRGARVGIGSLA